MNSAISKSTQSLATTEDMRNQTRLMMRPFACWEEYLTPGPLSIAILGELVFNSSSTDFSINKYPPKNGYKFIRYPDSFRSCLVQVCNSGCRAFNEAHRNMDQILLHTAQVPHYMMASVRILFQGDDESLRARLPDQLDSVRVIADECIRLSSGAEKSFTDAIDIIQEVLEACVNAEHFYGQEKRAIKKKQRENKSESTPTSQRTTENARLAIEQTRAQMKKTRETYEKCVENLEINQKDLEEILAAMRNCELKEETDFKTTTEMLVRGMDAIGRVKDQWEKTLHFFQMVSCILKTSLSKTFKTFLSTYEKTQTLSYNAKLFSKDQLYTQAFQVCNIASVVHMISATYTDASNRHLRDCVSSLEKLVVMDMSRPEFQHERRALQISCDEAQRGILRLVLKSKEEFDRKSPARTERIDQELLAILPAAPPEEIKRLHAGFSLDEASYY